MNSRINERATLICSKLSTEYRDTSPLLRFRNPFELLIAVILSAQTTDAQVNRITPALFERYPSARELSLARIEDVEQIVRPTGFYKTKARHIVSCADELLKRAGTVPEAMDDLTALPGVGRKTASVIRAVVYGLPAIIVDTHFARVAGRLGFTEQKDPLKIERQIAERVESPLWSDLSMLLNRHGRRYCTARAPRCDDCPVMSLCPFPTFADA